ncbi:polyprenol phosphomannose-dependent alpha 1,6 mannosyltransferase MptB [Nafulsella turpanensis]|uniref:polyprenol phosphomannose-dependent alpha 1,6 mannosyltransferase MptB n=1 Tax=Nafulsella turpanensis TaxID=1265690 RepID=UPI000348BAF8|nr:polyprenol phosphomannose-dependent alpha 1,6 mannosyltransferase MptB [Nafulsella turpanensis]
MKENAIAGFSNHPKQLWFIVIGLLYAVGLAYIGYFLQRTDTLPLLLNYSGLFGLCLLAYQKFERASVRQWLLLAMLLRLLLLPSFPNLSDDFYRFIWDGRLILAGEHPFAHTPEWYMQEEAPGIKGISEDLYRQLNSPHYHTIYPPLHQATFSLAAFVGQESIWQSVLVLRLLNILAEVLTLWLLLKLLRHYHQPQKALLLYALNPLIILELTGNLHFEAWMIAFLLLGLWSFERYKQEEKKTWLAGTALSLAGAIGSKLLPLMFIPLWFRRFSPAHLTLFLATGFVAVLLLFFPLYDAALFHGMQDSLSLYYQKFEFNASLYYLVREVGFWLKGYNTIGLAGPWMAGTATLLILLFSLSRKAKALPLPQAMLWVYCIYLLFSLTVHPWYITPLLALSLLTPYRFPLLWSGLVFFTYAGYNPAGFEEQVWVLWLEYGLSGLFALWEIRKYKIWSHDEVPVSA